MVKHIAVVVLVAVTCAIPRLLDAQSMNGALIGTLTDTDGGVLTGAMVRISSPALIGGSQLVTTDGRGQLRFPALPPGDYWLDIEVHGFRPYHEQNIRIRRGRPSNGRSCST